MDKYEYKVRADEIKDLIGKGEYAQAADIADTIDWRKVKSVMMLCTISDLYKINRRYEEARDMLLLAYERRPGGRTICYSLCELSIKMEDIVQAVEFYKEFVQVAPYDSGRYILQYKIYEAQDVSLEERIEVLEELKKKDYREKWAYELAYLYHRIGLATRCVEECDELILWFGEGRYVIKAMELKMLHQPLTPAQQSKYDNRFDSKQEEEAGEPEEQDEVSGQDVDSEKEAADKDVQLELQAPEYLEDTLAERSPLAAENFLSETKVFAPVPDNVMDKSTAEVEPEQVSEEDEIHVKTMDMSQYNTMNLQEELAAGLQEVLGETDKSENNKTLDEHYIVDYDADTDSMAKLHLNEMDDTRIEEGFVSFEETGEIPEVTVNSPDSSKAMDEVLWQDTDGQIGFVVPENEQVERQITGQLSIEDILAEWELMKKKNQQRHQEEFRKRVLEHTGEMFTEFEAQMRDGLLERLEKDAETESRAAAVPDLPDSLDGDETVSDNRFENVDLPDRSAEVSQDGEYAEGFESENYEPETLETEEYEPETLETEGYEPETLETEDYESETLETEGYEPETLETEEYEPETFETEEYEPETFESEGIEPKLPESDADEVEELEEIEEDSDYAEEDEFAEETLEEEEFAEEEPEEEEFAEEEPEEEEFAEEELAEEEPEEEEFAEEELAEEESEEEASVEEELAEEEPEEEEFAEEELSEDESKEESSVEEELTEDESKEESSVEEDPAEEESEGEGSEEDHEAQKEQSGDKVRHLTREEKELYEPFIQSKSSKEQLIHAIDNISMASYTGNLIITGEEGMDTLTLAKNVVKELQEGDSNFSGKVAKISGNTLNRKNVSETFEKLKNGALIIEKSSEMNEDTVQSMYQILHRENMGIVVIMEDNKKRMNRFLTENEKLNNVFTARIDVEALSNDALVAFGKKYANELEYSIDDFGILALHTRIENMQTSDHIVTVTDVKEIVDEAIEHANKKTLGHFFDILLSKRYDVEDMIILSEKDFV